MDHQEFGKMIKGFKQHRGDQTSRCSTSRPLEPGISVVPTNHKQIVIPSDFYNDMGQGGVPMFDWVIKRR